MDSGLPQPWELTPTGQLAIGGPGGHVHFEPSGVVWAAGGRSGDAAYVDLEDVLLVLPMHGRTVRALLTVVSWIGPPGVPRGPEIAVVLGTRLIGGGVGFGLGRTKQRFAYQNCYAVERLMDVLGERRALGLLGRPDVGAALVIDAFRVTTAGDLGNMKRIRAVVDDYTDRAG